MSGLLSGKRGLIMGVANERSIAWGIAKAMAEAGAELAFTYQGEAFGKRLEPLAATVGSDFMVDVDVTDEESLDAAFDALGARWPTIDFVVHAIAYSDKNELTGRFINTSRENFKNSLDISAYSFIDVARRAYPMMKETGGTLLTLTYGGSNRVTPNYNVMGVAKAALEASVRYLADDLGPDNIRVNAISAGPIKTLAASGIGDFRHILKWNELNSPMQRNVSIEQVGGAGLYLLSDMSGGVTGEIHHVDSGYHVVGMMNVDKAQELSELLGNFNPQS